MNKEDEEECRNTIICRFRDKKFLIDKVRDQCHLTGKNRGSAHQSCKFIVRQKQTKFNPFIFQCFSNYDCHLILKELIDRKNAEVKFHIIPETNEEINSLAYGSIRFFDSYRFLSYSLEELDKNLNNDDFKILNQYFLINGNI